MNVKKLWQILFFLVTCSLLVSLSSCSKKKEKKYVIGVSQCSKDIWRAKLVKELETAEYFNEELDIVCASTNGNNKEQIAQIDTFIEKKVDLLIVSPNEKDALTPIIDKAYDSGIPVILFDRRTNSKKYTAIIGGDNYLIGKSMAQFIASQIKNKGNVAEISGLQGSSPALERHRGFVDEIKKHPNIKIVDQKWSNWESDGGKEATQEILIKNKDIDYLFIQNDRMANGASEVLRKMGLQDKIKITGVDGLAVKGGGIEQVQKGNFVATYIYPTEGARVIELAEKILTHQPYQRENLFSSSIVTKDNADILYMQAIDAINQSENLHKLHGKVDTYINQLNLQRTGLYMTIIIIVLLIMVMTLGHRMLTNRQKMQKERARMKDRQLQFFTNVSHQIRTPLTLIADPIQHIVDRGFLKEKDLETLRATSKNASELMNLVENILDFKDAKFDETGKRIDKAEMIDDSNAAAMAVPEVVEDSEENQDETKNMILVVDDNADIRNYVKSIFCDNYQVFTASNGKEGLAIALEKIPDVIISDIMMPEMDGLEMTRQIRQNITISHIPVIMLTAKSQQEQIVEGYESGASDYLTKPFSSKVIVARINNMMETKERLQKKLWEQYQRELDASSNSGDGRTNENSLAKENIHISTKDESFLGKLHKYIEENLGNNDINVETMGTEMGLSRVQLYRKVKALTGMTPVELLRKARLAHAKHLLETTNMSISEICYEVGFSAPSYFTKCYKDEFGVTPSSK